MEKKEVSQALLIADNFNDNFAPITNSINVGLLPMVNVPLIDYALETLNRSGIEEVFIFCSTFKKKLKDYIVESISKKCSWSVDMSVQVVGSEGCRCLGDALRDIDAKGLLRGHFLLLNCDTVTNADLNIILEQHKRKCKLDKGAALTVVYKKNSSMLRTGDEVMVAIDKDSNRLLFHQRINPLEKERHFALPLEMFLVNSEVTLHHDLTDPQIAVCAPSVLPLFTDNFDFESRDDFIRGLLINEEILGNSIYCIELPTEQFAGKVSNWQTYLAISNDIINRWVYPLVPDMGICSLKQNYLFLRNNVYKNKDVQLARSGILKENVVIHENSSVGENSTLSHTIVGRNCKIGNNCFLDNVFLFDNVTIEESCTLCYCIVGKGATLLKGATVKDGSVLDQNVIIDANCQVVKYFVQATPPDYDDRSIKLGENAYTITDKEDEIRDSNSDDEDEELQVNTVRMAPIEFGYASSYYSSTSDDEDSTPGSPIPDDTNIFLSEVIDSLTRGYDEKSNPDFLILEINSSRYAYNMTLTEVNFFVVRAILSLKTITNAGTDIMIALKQILSHLNPVLKNYIRGKDAMRDCLNAIEDACNYNENIKTKAAQIIHHLYDKEIIDEDAILMWHEHLDEEHFLRTSLKKLIDWLEASSEENSSEDE